MPSISVLSAQEPDERLRWVSLWESWPEREPAAHPGYVELFARDSDLSLCAVSETSQGGILFPFILRPIGVEPWAAGADDGVCDITSPLGYGGAFCWPEGDAAKEEFWARFEEWAVGRQVVSTFVRMSLFPNQVLPFPGTERFAQTNVVRGLHVSDETLWMDYEHKVRKNVRQRDIERCHCPDRRGRGRPRSVPQCLPGDDAPANG